MPSVLTGRRVRILLECVHPVFLLALLCPFFYTLYRERVDRQILPFYLIGTLLLISITGSRAAAEKAKSFGRYLLSCAISGGITVLAVKILSSRFLSGPLKVAVLTETIIGIVLFSAGAARIRVREKRRQRAKELNDISWEENEGVLEKPRIVFLLWFLIVYLAGLLCHCPVTCNLAFLSGLLYLLLLFCYLRLEAFQKYQSEISGIANVPMRKINRISMGMLLLFLLAVLLLSIPSLFTISSRPYMDLRFREEQVSFPKDEMWPGWLLEPGFGDADELAMVLEGMTAGNELVLPAWAGYLGNVFFAAVFLLVCLALFRLIFAWFLEFRGVLEENRDTAERLEEDFSRRLRSFRGRFFPRRSTEREKIRRLYRRTIRKYRKDLPKNSETPVEIEAKTEFPDDFQVRELHEQYEWARYRF